MEGFKSETVKNVMWNSDVVAETWCEVDGRLFRETLAPLNLISVTVAATAVQLQGAPPPAALATAGIRELPARANERALSRWDRDTLQGPRG